MEDYQYGISTVDRNIASDILSSVHVPSCYDSKTVITDQNITSYLK